MAYSNHHTLEASLNSIHLHGKDGITEQLLHTLEQSTLTPREIALLRIRLLSKECNGFDEEDASKLASSSLTRQGIGLASLIVPILSEGVVTFVSQARIHDNAEFRLLRRVLQLFLRLVQNDPTLAEEMGRLGAHIQLTRLMRFLPHECNEECEDIMDEIQDLAGEIAIASRPQFPILGVNPFAEADLRARLPLVFAIPSKHTGVSPGPYTGNDTTVLIRQVTDRQSEQADVGFVMWPSAVVLACWLATDASWLTRVTNDIEHAPTILELGAGCGLTGLVVAASLLRHTPNSSSSRPAHIILTDFNPTVLENLSYNVALNDLSEVCSVAALDFYQQMVASECPGTTEVLPWIDMAGIAHAPVDIVFGADIICRQKDAKAIANTLRAVLKPNGLAYIVCADAAHRFGVECFVNECELVDLLVETRDAREIYDEATQLSNLEQTAGFIEGMNLTLFTICKTVK